MRLRPEQLQAQLQKQLLPVYLVTGDEPLLVQEACDAIRARCREAGCSDREVIHVDGRFNWDNLLASSAEMSLFADSKLIELRIPSGKPGANGSKALLAYLERPVADDILLIVAGKIDKQSTKSKWFKALDKAGAVVQVWPVDARELPRWMQQRLQQAGLKIDKEALQLLCERVEGNLLAAVQEIEKLRLLCPGDHITVEAVSESVADNARYNLFALVDRAQQGDAAGALKMLQGLRAEGTETTVVLWALSREIRLLYQCQTDISRGQSQQQALRAQRVWDKRLPIVGAGLARHPLNDLAELLHRANLADQSIKGLNAGQPWDHLSGLVLDLARGVQPGS
ncbi:MAG: DNA polymerase III subunit delta [Halieaceae bacterium]